MHIKLDVLYVHYIPVPPEQSRSIVRRDVVRMVSFSPVRFLLSFTFSTRLKVQVRHLHTPSTRRRRSRYPEFVRLLKDLLLRLSKHEYSITTTAAVTYQEEQQPLIRNVRLVKRSNNLIPYTERTSAPSYIPKENTYGERIASSTTHIVASQPR